MTVNHEIKSQLAKLLATEDLIVENKKVETAQFNVQTRVLTLPQWERASNNVYDSLVAHEVGHALYTPNEWDWLGKIPQNYVNVCEDVRIEKLMKRRYAGLAKTFYTGYNELNDNDFFNLEDEDIDTLSLADRINLYYKVGAWNDISFSVPEKEIVSLIGNTETFEDVIKVAKVLYEYCKEELENLQKLEEDINKFDVELEDEGDTEIPEPSISDDKRSIEDDLEESIEPNPDESYGGTAKQENVGGKEFNPEPQVKTVESLEKALQDLNSLESSETQYFELPKLNLDDIIIPNNIIDKIIKDEFAEQVKEWEENKYADIDDMFQSVDKEYDKFKKSAQKEVNYLVKEFECKKSASAYARASVSRTGVLSTNKLHTYKFNEDLFKKVTTIPDGKNHGLVFVLDWSGSMSPFMMDTIKQLYNLIWFCNKVKIPFDVYAFTNSFPKTMLRDHVEYERKEGIATVEETFSMMNILTSKVRSKKLDEQLRNIFRIAASFDNSKWTLYRPPTGMSLSGTPLNETIISLHQILPKFKNDNKLEKVQCVILTDGEGQPLRFNKGFLRHWDTETFMGTAPVSHNTILRNRKTGRTYDCSRAESWTGVTDLLLEDLRDTFPSINLIGIRVMDSRDAGYFVRKYLGYDCDVYEKVMKRWKKEKSFGLKTDGYHKYFGISSSALSNDSEFEVQEDATKAQIKKAFAKSLKTKKMNKKILGEFIELVA